MLCPKLCRVCRRRVLFFSLFALTLLLFTVASAQAQVSSYSFQSALLGEEREILVYTPPGYDEDLQGGYPLVLFLHGATNDGAHAYETVGLLVHSGVQTGAIPPMVMAFPDGRVPASMPRQYDGSFYTDSELYGPFETHMMTEVLTWVRSEFNVSTEREDNAIMGHSMGGFGAMKLAMRHGDVFSIVAAHSGPFSAKPANLTTVVDSLLLENEPGPPYTFDPDAGNFSGLAYSMAGAFSPDLDATPEPVEFPVNGDGSINSTVLEQWYPHFPATSARTYLDNLNSLSIYFDCGYSDELGVYPMNATYRDTLNALGVPHIFRGYDGDHAHALPSRIPISLLFIGGHIDGTMPVEGDGDWLPESAEILALYPNPFNAISTLSFRVPMTMHARVSVYNLMGRLVATPLDAMVPGGQHRVVIQGQNWATGTYIAVLQTPGYSETRKMILLR